ncbi:MAG: carbohydrate kinase [Pseudomonadota bacterium]
MILCCGEALIDMIPQDLPFGNSGFLPVSGGSVFSTSIALGRLDVNAGLLTAISTDMFGDQLMTSLAASNVSTDLIIRSPQPTTLAFVKLVNGQAQYAFFDEQSAERQLRASDVPDLPDSVSALYFGGISLAREPAGDFYAALAQRYQGQMPIMVDPNIRQGFIQDEAAYRARLKTMMGAADIVKVSDEDLAWLIPDQPTDQDRVAALREMGPRLVVLTRGEEGASAWLSEGASVHVPARKMKVADTVGAGDTFNAGFLASLQKQGAFSGSGLQTLTPEVASKAMTYAAKAAGITVSRVGANPPWAREVV